MKNFIKNKEQNLSRFSNKDSVLKPETCNQKLTLHHAQEVAKNQNGKCLSEEYINVDTKLKWQCEFGHQWDSSLYSVRNIGSWCHYCAGFAKLTIDEMKQLAERKKGKCLSTIYINSSTKLTWECELGHQWKASPSSIKGGHWCRRCAGLAKHTIEQMHEIAKQQGGECLSKEYINSKTKLKWKCKLGHIWDAQPSSILSGTWCGDCSGNVKLSIEHMNEIAALRDGKCLSNQYINSKSKMLWECKYGHTWLATAGDIRDSKWCSICYCSKRRGENAVRNFFESIFNTKFPSARPEWLIFEGKRIELDGYSESLKIAFEYQGRYHFNEKDHWYPNKSISFKRRQLIDAHKRIACIENNTTLIEIHEFNPRDNPIKWKNDIKKTIESSGVVVPENFDDVPFGRIEFFSSKNYLDEAHEIATMNKGQCLSKIILYREQHVEWECSLGHTWAASLSQVILRNTWCPTCAGKKKLNIEEMRALAINNNGLCISTTYTNAKTKLKWQCEFGHQWDALPLSIKRGSWCPTCFGRVKFTIEIMHDLAKQRGGECLSKVYVNTKSKLTWKCQFDHIWDSRPSNIILGKWCHHCGGSFKLTIENMQELARSKGGKCLSTVYVNARTKLLWECSEGHQWFAVPSKIKNTGRWCKQCKKIANQQ